MYEKYYNEIYMRILGIFKDKHRAHSVDTLTTHNVTDNLIYIKYDHGQLDYSITPALPSQRHTKPAPRDAVIDDGSE
jgi:hypothetical protein